MQTNILWTGHLNQSLENCLLTTDDTGAQVDSVIIGCYEQKIFRVDYRLRTNQNRETVFLELHTRFDGKKETVTLENDGAGNWTKNGSPAHALQRCMEVDISLTPFTNTLPINRLKLRTGKTERIKVLYCDVLGRTINPVFQQYTRLTEAQYKFENVPNDFEAIITVNEAGLVINYPGLFMMRAAQEI